MAHIIDEESLIYSYKLVMGLIVHSKYENMFRVFNETTWRSNFSGPYKYETIILEQPKVESFI